MIGCFWSEIERSIFFNFSDGFYSRKIFVYGDANVDVVFVIAHDDVVFRMKFFDEIGFEKNRFEFTANLGIFDVGDLFDHFSFSEIEISIFLEITSDAIFEIFGFSYVNNDVRFVFETIDARTLRERFENVFDFGAHLRGTLLQFTHACACVSDSRRSGSENSRFF